MTPRTVIRPGNLCRAFCFAVLLGTVTTVAKSVEVHGRSCLSGKKYATAALATENTSTLVEEAFCAMYDFDFSTAEAKLAQFSLEHPDDPMGPAAQTASGLFSILEQHKILQREFFLSDDRFTKRKKFTPDTTMRTHMELALNRAEQLAAQKVKDKPADEGALFAMTLVYGLRADYAALVERQDLAALRFSNKGNEWARKLIAVSPHFYDAYVATGIQKYLVGLKPAPVRWMLRLGGFKGNRDEGLQELELAAAKGHYLAPFARVLLAVAYLRKLEQQKSVEILAGLSRQFPHNTLFAKELSHLTPKGSTPLADISTLDEAPENTSDR